MPKTSKKDLPADIKTSGFDGYIVCVGASAGGLEALEKFFNACPADTGAAFVVVQHLSPDHKSMMSNLLTRYTKMPVTMVEEAMPIKANHVFLIPPGAIMHVSAGHLHLTPKSPHGLTLAIDIFLSSLGDIYGKQAVGIILSGTGTDGTRGAVAINAAGGFVMAQEPDSAKFDGMPRSVIGTGVVDAVLSAEELPARLVAHINRLPYTEALAISKVIPYAAMPPEDVVAAILQLLYQIGGIDFSDYKPATVMRRIERRMQVRQTQELSAYLDLLENDRGEVLTLRREMLISVTSFFRDPETFEELSNKVIAPMIAKKLAGDTIRVWIAGVASGEEAYTIGMLFLEAFECAGRWPNLKIFATDVDPQCVETASNGQYPESAAAELSPERLERFFDKNGDSFVVKKELRQCIVFARHNLLSDPPFTKIDLVSCRNTLIYFKSAAQERALRSLQYAINQNGALLLGPSESLATITEGLQSISAKHKLFRRKGVAKLPFLDRQGGAIYPHPLVRRSPVVSKSGRRSSDVSLSDAGLATLINKFAPPAIMVNENQEAVHLYGDVNVYLYNREGMASLEINRLLPDPLIPVASALLYKANHDGCSLVSDLVDVTLNNGEHRTLRISVHPVPNENQERLTLLCFEAVETKNVSEIASVNLDAVTVERVAILQRELAATRDSLQSTIEELETSNEELQATNEELMSSNEELQSSNEELQSVNEEMNTVNDEFQEKMLLLNRAHADLDGMAKASGVATVFVDSQLLITRFSPDASLIFKLRDADIGRPLDEVANVLNYPELMDDLTATIKTERMIEREINTLDLKKTYLVRILPYQVASTTVRGVVATFVDVTAYHDVNRLQSIIDALPEHIAVVDPAGTIVMINAGWRRFAMANGDKELKRSGPGVNYLDVCQAGNHEDDAIARAAIQGLRGVLEGSLPLFSMGYPCHSSTEQRWFVMNVAPVAGKEFGAVISHVNISGSYLQNTP
ncbi:chemotaxis protein CheB [Methylomonas methanica]|uniref:protein-glutamate O-methyltransferase n=1 Tax=Methylomonas methanica TaxID=421 RepID=A0A177M7T4_METMH|nr:chemotaxis protein CheB [Methylomonas methanica]OAI01425.1 chemotaxis protein CheR [Methylomonas methanica]